MERQKWYYNKNYFKNIDNVDKAYWLGFIMADGYIMDTRNVKNNSGSVGLRIRLSEVDRTHLEGLNECLNCDKPIKIVKNYGIYENQHDLAEFTLNSRKLCEDLKLHLDINPHNKSCMEKFPKLNDSILIKNFILGLFDGDGSISYYTSGKLFRAEWQIVSSKEILEDIQQFLLEELGFVKFQKISKNSNKKDNNLYRLRIGDIKSIIKVCEYLYFDSTEFFLKRKYDTYQFIRKVKGL